MKFLNGLKTALGAAGLILTVAVPRFAPSFAEASPHILTAAEGVFGTLLAFGVIHKIEKANTKTPGA